MPFEKPAVQKENENQNELPINCYAFEVVHQGVIRPDNLRNMLVQGQPIYFGIDLTNKKVVYSFDAPTDPGLIIRSFKLKQISTNKLEGYVAELGDDITGPPDIMSHITTRELYQSAMDKIQEALGIRDQGKIDQPDEMIKKALEHGK